MSIIEHLISNNGQSPCSTQISIRRKMAHTFMRNIYINHGVNMILFLAQIRYLQNIYCSCHNLQEIMQLNPQEYRPRLADEKLAELLSAFGGVLIVGPKWCGKSWTASMQARSEVYIDLKQNRERARLLPDAVLEGESPRLIDEWQDAPILWDEARRRIDSLHRPGLFIFTGSSVPPEEETSHTGTGRFARMQMRPLSLFESGDSIGTVSL